MSMVPSGSAWEICCSLPSVEAGEDIDLVFVVGAFGDFAGRPERLDMERLGGLIHVGELQFGLGRDRQGDRQDHQGYQGCARTRVRMVSSPLSDGGCF